MAALGKVVYRSTAKSTKKIWLLVLLLFGLFVTLVSVYKVYHTDGSLFSSVSGTKGALLDLHSISRDSGLANDTKDPCDVSSLKPWDRGVISELQPPIQRDCQLLRQNDKKEVSRVKQAMQNWKSSNTFVKWSLSLNNCSNVVKEFSNNFYVSQEELDFPLAFSFIVYTNSEQIVRLLKAIYRPHNLYCIQPDANYGEEFASVFRRLSACLDNVFVASKPQKINYSYGLTIIDAQLNCLTDFMKFPSQRWKYVINICGREVPIKSNRAMVKSLKKLNGVSAIRTSEIDAPTMKDRLTRKFDFNTNTGQWYRTREKFGTPPHHIKLYKSMTYIAASRPFADFILTSNVSKDLYNYLKDAKIPEEHFYPSLYHHPGTPGGYKPDVPVPEIDGYKWMYNREETECAGDIIHGICILSVGELFYIHNIVVKEPDTFFFNKYFMEKDHVVMDCMEEWLLQQNLLEYKQDCTS